MQLKTKEDFENLITGAKILGCGGGGEESAARARVKFILDNKLNVKVIEPEKIAKDALICVAGMVGGRITPQYLSHVKGLPEVNQIPILSATKLLESFLNKKLHSLVSTEIGAGNFLAPILVSAILGITIIDGDLCGRAKPEISISTSNIVSIPVTPLTIVSSYGDEIILNTTKTDQRAEAIAREVAVLSGGAVGVARCPAYWCDYQKAVIPKTMSLAQKLGATILESHKSDSNPLPEIIKTINAHILFSGKVKSFEINDESGFVVGTIILKNDKNDFCKVWFKNEYLIAWLNDKPLISSPDVICIIDAITAEGLTPWSKDFHNDREVVLLGSKNAPIWYTPKGLEIFGPRHFGFNFDYYDFKKMK